MLYHNLTPEQRASLAAMYRALARCVVWAGYDPRPDMIMRARELERGDSVHVHDAGAA